jgi:hypothetical protein
MAGRLMDGSVVLKLLLLLESWEKKLAEAVEEYVEEDIW